ncbi:hypothetical protein Tco_1220560 [Tanacetum coccineum]
MDTSSSSIAFKLKSPTFSTSPLTNSYLNLPISPPPRVPPPSRPLDLLKKVNPHREFIITPSPITPLDIQFNTPSPPPPFFGHLFQGRPF